MPKIISLVLQFLVIFLLVSLFTWFDYNAGVILFLVIAGGFYALRIAKTYFDI